METAAGWKNRIVDHAEADPMLLAENPKNWRVHPEHQREALSQVLDKVGWVQDVIVNKRTGMIVDGHLRVSLAIERGEKGVPVKYVDLSEEEEALILASIDPIAALAETDSDRLSELLDQVFSEDDEALLEQIAEVAGIEMPDVARAAGDPPVDPGVNLDDAEQLQQEWQVEPGDLWVIDGRHVIVCGDAADSAVYERIFQHTDGKLVELVFTDPPYGVAIGDKNVFLSRVGKAHHKRVKENISNDTLDTEALGGLLMDVFTNVLDWQEPGGAWYVTAPLGPAGLPFALTLSELGLWRQMLIWQKNVATFAPMGVDYHWKTEGIYYGWKPGGAHRFYGGRQQDNVWEVAKEQKSPLHPTMKPLELVERAIQNSSKKDEVVIDPFLGSGTTVVAAARMERVGIGIEVDPKYVAASLHRLTEMGYEAERHRG